VGAGPGESGDNRKAALGNMLDALASQIEASGGNVDARIDAILSRLPEGSSTDANDFVEPGADTDILRALLEGLKSSESSAPGNSGERRQDG